MTVSLISDSLLSLAWRLVAYRVQHPVRLLLRCLVGRGRSVARPNYLDARSSGDRTPFRIGLPLRCWRVPRDLLRWHVASYLLEDLQSRVSLSSESTSGEGLYRIPIARHANPGRMRYVLDGAFASDPCSRADNLIDVGVRVLFAAPLRGSSAATLRIGGECGRSVGGGCFVRSAEQILGLRVGLGSLQDGASLVVLGASVRTRGAGVCLALCLPL